MTVVDLYTIQLIDDRGKIMPPPPYPLARVVLDEMLAEVEENLTDLLPAGYRARIRRWDHPDEPTQEDDDE